MQAPLVLVVHCKCYYQTESGLRVPPHRAHKSQVRLSSLTLGEVYGLRATGPLVIVRDGVLGTHGYGEFGARASFRPCSSLLHF